MAYNKLHIHISTLYIYIYIRNGGRDKDEACELLRTHDIESAREKRRRGPRERYVQGVCNFFGEMEEINGTLALYQHPTAAIAVVGVVEVVVV